MTLLGALPVAAGVPGWLQAAAREPLPDYPEDTEAVQLLEEQITTVNDRGEIKTRYRRAYKILRPGGGVRGTVTVYYDNETRLTYLKGWSLPPGEKEYEVKEKEAVDTTPFSYALYQDTVLRTLRIPAAEPGSVVGYEYEQKRRPFILQDSWWFTDTIPVRRARYALELPADWGYETYWVHHPPREPVRTGKNTYVWQVEDVPAVETEPAMPHWRAVAGRLHVSFFAPRGDLEGKSHASWKDVGRWYWNLARGRRQLTPEIRAKTDELTAGAGTLLDKVETLAGFVQREVRYVAIEIGIGGYQPHPAGDVFANRYGDCKDKATLLAAMLEEVGAESYYVLVHTRRGVVAADAPSAYSFNHAILAVRLPEQVDTAGLYAVSEHPALGQLLFFDPTDERTRFGYLPPSEQANYGLVVTEAGGELVELPLQSPTTNRLLRQAEFELTPAGALAGGVVEVRWGVPAVGPRSALLAVPQSERAKVLERVLAQDLGEFRLRQASVENLEEHDKTLVLRYQFAAGQYAKEIGNLLLVRPRVLGKKGIELLLDEGRKHPVEFPGTSAQSDIVQIRLPAGYEVDELPPAVELVNELLEYRSETTVEEQVLHYRREYRIKNVLVPTARLEELRQFFRQVAADERQHAVLKRVAP